MNARGRLADGGVGRGVRSVDGDVGGVASEVAGIVGCVYGELRAYKAEAEEGARAGRRD